MTIIIIGTVDIMSGVVHNITLTFLLMTGFVSLMLTKPVFASDILWNVVIYMSSEVHNLEGDDKKFSDIIKTAQTAPGITNNLHLSILYDPASPDRDVQKTIIHQGAVIERSKMRKPVNFGNPKTLKHFLMSHSVLVPAKHHALIISGDGGSLGKSYPFSVGYDYGDNLDSLTASEIRNTLQEVVHKLPNYKFDLLAFDACFMGSLEILYELKRVAHYAVAGESLFASSAFPYRMLSHFNTSPEWVAKGIIKNAFDIKNVSLTQFVAVDLTKLGNITTSMKSFLEALISLAKKAKLERHEFLKWRRSARLFENMHVVTSKSVDLEKWLTAVSRDVEPLRSHIDKIKFVLNEAIIARSTDVLKQVDDEIQKLNTRMTMNDISRWADRLHVDLSDTDLSPELLHSIVVSGNPIPRKRELIRNRQVYNMLKMLKRMHQNDDSLYWSDGLSIFLPDLFTENGLQDRIREFRDTQSPSYFQLDFPKRSSWHRFLHQLTNWDKLIEDDPYKYDNEDELHDVRYDGRQDSHY